MSNNIEAITRVVAYDLVDVGIVDTKLMEGWQPYGNVVVSASLGGAVQPMVKREYISVDEYTELTDIIVEVAQRLADKMEQAVREK